VLKAKESSKAATITGHFNPLLIPRLLRNGKETINKDGKADEKIK
jgi:hypothetical protein